MKAIIVKHKMLFLARTLPMPCDRGERIRLNSFLEAFNEKYQIDYFSIYSKSDNASITESIEKYANVRFQILDIEKRHQLSSIGKFCYPEVVKHYYDKDAIIDIHKRIVMNKYEIIFFKGLQFAQWFIDSSASSTFLSKHQILFDMDDIESKKKRRSLKYLDVNFGRTYICNYLDCKKLRIYERKCLNKFKIVIYSSEDDALYYRKRTKKKSIISIRNCIKIKSNNFESTSKKSMLFLGSLGYDPNEDAVKYFLNDIYPKIIELDAHVEFSIAGTKPPTWLNYSTYSNKIKVLGYVENLQRLMSDNMIMVVPLRIGGGTRLKILDAIANNVPVVSTSIGAEGLPFVHEKDLLIADTPDDFAHQCYRLLNNEKLREKLICNSKNILNEHFSFTKVKNDILNATLI